MLVDSRTSPLRVAAIHRVVADLTLATALAAAGETVFTVAAGRGRPRRGPGGAGARRPAPTRSSSPTARPTGCSTDPDPAARRGGPAGRAAGPVAVAGRQRAAPACCSSGSGRSPTTPRRVGYLHDARLRRCGPRDARHGVAVLMRPVAVADVLALAAEGERMPRKSTSFGPKPRTGLVLRLLDD